MGRISTEKLIRNWKWWVKSYHSQGWGVRLVSSISLLCKMRRGNVWLRLGSCLRMILSLRFIRRGEGHGRGKRRHLWRSRKRWISCWRSVLRYIKNERDRSSRATKTSNPTPPTSSTKRKSAPAQLSNLPSQKQSEPTQPNKRSESRTWKRLGNPCKTQNWEFKMRRNHPF
jgi:hypothetical protein